MVFPERAISIASFGNCWHLTAGPGPASVRSVVNDSGSCNELAARSWMSYILFANGSVRSRRRCLALHLWISPMAPRSLSEKAHVLAKLKRVQWRHSHPRLSVSPAIAKRTHARHFTSICAWAKNCPRPCSHDTMPELKRTAVDSQPSKRLAFSRKNGLCQEV